MDLERNLKSFLSDRNISFRESGKSLICDCVNPSCKKEKHMYIHKNTGFTTCFKCGHKWNWRALISEIDGCEINESIIKLGVKVNNDPNKIILDFGLEEDDTQYIKDEEYFTIGKDFVPVEDSTAGMNYLRSRGIDDSQSIFMFDIRWHEIMQAVVFPIKVDGLVYGWQARKVSPGPNEPRLLTKTGMNKANFLLNYDNVINSQDVVVVEGPFDCLKIQQAGIGAIATFGSNVSNRQIDIISGLKASRIYNGLDPDAFLQSGDLSKKLLNKSKKEIFRIIPPKDKKDFGECSSEEIKESKKNAVKLGTIASYLDVYLRPF